ncbi:MAG TPA: hypothetical protein VKB41_10405 [Steroidobacteraceae bacterium]|jgi:hypothetical protein|nr:hypothetical protein [Steroidobacteraceae bacterium]
MSLRAYHLPEHEYQGDDRFERALEALRFFRDKARTAGQSLNNRLSVYSEIQLNARSAPERAPCKFSL